MTGKASDPHAGRPVAMAGAPLGQARQAMVLIHGRGSTAESTLALAAEFQRPEFVYLAPQAAGNSWYPYRFLAPIAHNEPALTSALAAIGSVLTRVQAAGIALERTVCPYGTTDATLAPQPGWPRIS